MRNRLFVRLAAVAVVVAAALSFTADSARAALLTGEIAITGLWVPTGGATINTATGVQVTTAFVTGALGDFSGLAPGTPVAYNQFDFSPASTPVTPLWTVGGFSFDLLTLSVDGQSPTELALSGTGIYKAPGFEDTPAFWTFTGNNAGGSLFSFSDTSIPTVAEPSSLGLLGLGLVGIGLAMRRRARMAA